MPFLSSFFRCVADLILRATEKASLTVGQDPHPAGFICCIRFFSAVRRNGA